MRSSGWRIEAPRAPTDLWWHARLCLPSACGLRRASAPFLRFETNKQTDGRRRSKLVCFGQCSRQSTLVCGEHSESTMYWYERATLVVGNCKGGQLQRRPIRWPMIYAASVQQ